MDILYEKLNELDDLQKACLDCGLCLEFCPTYQATGWEQESPRGRIKIIRDFIDGKIRPDSPSLQLFDPCLGCSLCEKNCPYSVKCEKIFTLVQTIKKIALSEMTH